MQKQVSMQQVVDVPVFTGTGLSNCPIEVCLGAALEEIVHAVITNKVLITHPVLLSEPQILKVISNPFLVYHIQAVFGTRRGLRSCCQS